MNFIFMDLRTEDFWMVTSFVTIVLLCLGISIWRLYFTKGEDN